MVSPSKMFLSLCALSVALVSSGSLLVSGDSGPTAVKLLPGISQLVDTMFTGYIDTGDAYDSQIFYWMAEARNPKANASETPIVLWLQGTGGRGRGKSGSWSWPSDGGRTGRSRSSLYSSPPPRQAVPAVRAGLGGFMRTG